MPRKTQIKIESAQENGIKIGLGNIIAIIVLIGLVMLAGWWLSRYQKPAVISEVSSAQSIAYDCDEGQTVLSVLQEKASIQTQDSDYGVYVDEINGTANDNGGFWIYYVNSEMGQIGADQYQCKAGDKVEWRYEKLL